MALLRFNNTFIVQRSFAFAMERFLFHADFADFAEVIFLQRFFIDTYSAKILCVLRVICVRHKERCPQPSVAVK